ncbi:MAG: hypothetical protein ABL961_18645, partial [Vicinamibacterales bacterium]
METLRETPVWSVLLNLECSQRAGSVGTHHSPTVLRRRATLTSATRGGRLPVLPVTPEWLARPPAQESLLREWLPAVARCHSPLTQAPA